MGRSQRFAHRLGGWPIAVGVALMVVAGCGAHDRLAPDPQPRPSAAAADPAVSDCQGRVDHLIEADIIPRSDRDYAIGMCVDNPKRR